MLTCVFVQWLECLSSVCDRVLFFVGSHCAGHDQLAVHSDHYKPSLSHTAGWASLTLSQPSSHKGSTRACLPHTHRSI
eukprot:m.230432 g.230432  ORF g.230432 m.230432 type:complete len:78 (-) comp39699_c0_seq1:1008-1241(-)